MHSAIASIQCALRRGDREERISLNGNVEWIAGRLDGTIGVVDVGGAVLHEGDAVVAAGPTDIGLEQLPVCLEAGRICIRDIVGDDFELPLQGDLG